MSSSGRSVLLLGATGLVGSECLRLLLEDEAVARVVVLSRRALNPEITSSKLELHLVDFEHLTTQAQRFDVDQIICALGTTIREAGSRERFRTVDFLFPITAAHLGLEKGASHFLLVSSTGANAASRVFYNRTKGELENALRALSYRSLTIVRPSLLLGRRERPRLMERVAGALLFAAPGRFRPVTASSVAGALVRAARADMPGLTIIESSEIGEGEKPTATALRATIPAI